MDEQVQQAISLYDECRYVDVWTLHEPLFSSGDQGSASPALLAALGRVALRLGGHELGRDLVRRASEKDPQDPVVRHFQQMLLADEPLLDYWKRAAVGDYSAVAPAFVASVAGSRAMFFAAMKDAGRAWRCIAEGRAQGLDNPWLDCASAWVLMTEEKWAEAWSMALNAWKGRPNYPHTAEILFNLAPRLERTGDLLDLFTEAAPTCQSYETALVMHRLGSALASQPGHGWGAKAMDLARKGLELAEATAPMAGEELKDHLRTLRTGLETLEGRPEPRIIPCRRVYQGRDTCVPASISTLASIWEPGLELESLVARMTLSGTETFTAVKVLGDLGYRTRLFRLDRETAVGLVKEGLPFMVVLRNDSGGHAMTALGLTEDDQVLLVHDPNQLGLVSMPLGELEKAGPFGVLAMAVVPEAMEFPDLPFADSGDVEAYFRCLSLMTGLSAKALRDELTALPSSPSPSSWRIRAEALVAQIEGRYGDERDLLLGMYRDFPKASELEGMVVDAMGRCGDQAAYRRWLEEAARVEPAGFMVRLRLAETWLGFSASASRGEALLHTLQKEQGSSAMVWSALARAWGQSGRRDDADTAWEIATLLDPRNEGLALAHATALHRTRGAEAALAWMLARAERFAGQYQGDLAFSSIIETPWCPTGSALSREVLARGLALYPESGPLNERRAALLMEDQDREGLASALASGLVGGHRLSGPGIRLQQALRNGSPDLWTMIQELDGLRPDLPWIWDLGFRLAQVTGGREGGREWLLRKLAALPQYPLLGPWVVNALRELEFHGDADRVVADILASDPDEGFALRDRAFRLVARYPETMPPGALAAFSALVWQVRSLLPRDPACRMLDLELARYREGDLEAWAEGLRDLATSEPSYGYSLVRLMDTIEALERPLAQNFMDHLLDFVARCPEAQWASQRLLVLAGQCSTVRSPETLAAQWVEGGDLRLAQGALEAAAMRLDFLPPVLWTQRVEALAREEAGDWALCLAVGRYLYAAGADSEAKAVLEATLRRYPLYFPARTLLAQVLRGQEDPIAAVGVLEEGLRLGLLTHDLALEYAQALDACGEPVKALRLLDSLPDRDGRLPMLDRRQALLHRLRRAGDAEPLRQRRAEAFPEAPVVVEDRIRAALGAEGREKAEAEEALRELIARHPDRYESRDLLATMLHEGGRSPEALEVLAPALRSFNRVPAEGRALWIRSSGKDQETVAREWIQLLLRFPTYEWGWSMLTGALGGIAEVSGRSAILEELWPLLRLCPHRVPSVLEDGFTQGMDLGILMEGLGRLVEAYPQDNILIWNWYYHARTKDMDEAPGRLTALLERLSLIHGQDVTEGLPVARYLAALRYLLGDDQDPDPAHRFLDLPENLRRPWEWELWTRTSHQWNLGYAHTYLEFLLAGKLGYQSFDLFLSFKAQDLFAIMRDWEQRPAVLRKAPEGYWTGALGRALCESAERLGEPRLFAMASRLADYIAKNPTEAVRYHGDVGPWREAPYLWPEFNYWYSHRKYPRHRQLWHNRDIGNRPRVFLWNTCNLVTTWGKLPSWGLVRGFQDRSSLLGWALETLVPDHTFRYLATLHAHGLLERRRYDEFRAFCIRHAGTWDEEVLPEGDFWGRGLKWDESWGLRYLCRAVARSDVPKGLSAHEDTRTISPSYFWHEAALFPEGGKALKPFHARVWRSLREAAGTAWKIIAMLLGVVVFGIAMVNVATGRFLAVGLVIAMVMLSRKGRNQS